MSLYRCTCAVLYFGEMKFKQRPREEQGEADGTAGACHELSQRLVRYCSVEDATLEGAVCCR